MPNITTNHAITYTNTLENYIEQQVQQGNKKLE